ncbi:MAG: glycosyltransferase family 4 protein [Thermodesulfobacteriota bacterium]
MKIVLLCYRGNPYCGGQGVYLYFLSREMARRGHEVTILVGFPKPWPMPWARVIYIENLNLWGKKKDFLPVSPWRIFHPLNFYELAVTRLGFFPEMFLFSLRALRVIKELMNSEKIEIIHDIQSLGYGLLFLKLYGRPLITTVHHPLTVDRQASLERNKNFKEKYYSLVFYPIGMQRQVIRYCDRIITSSQESAKEIQQAFHVSADKIRMVYNGLDADFFYPLYLPRKANSLLFVGNTDDPKKGIKYLLQALTLLPPHINLTIVDEGPPQKTYAADLVKKYSLTSRVIFTGKVAAEKLRLLYNTVTLVVLPSLYEGFGLPAAEAMACGTAVIATKAGALPEVVGEEGAGLLVPPRNAPALAQAIKEVVQDEKKIIIMGEVGRRRVEKLFTWNKVAEKTEAVYKEFS